MTIFIKNVNLINGDDMTVIKFTNAKVYDNNNFLVKDLLFSFDDVLSDVVQEIDATDYCVFPGLADVHVHFREPGFSYKETIYTGSRAGAKSGYTAVCTMPNLNPVPDNIESVRIQRDIIQRDAVIPVLPFGAITVNQGGKILADLEGLAPYVCGFSDDGKGVDDEGLMYECMQRAKTLNKVVSAHCEDGSQIKDSPQAEWKEIERDLILADKTGCKYHVCHISTKESVQLIRDAKKSGVDVTCETAPHYLTLCNDDVIDDGRYKMNPPLRNIADKKALIQGLIDGTIDMIATDHAPHSKEEKNKGYVGSLNGIVGLETAFPIMYTNFVKNGIISIGKLIQVMSYNPISRFNLPTDGVCVYDLTSQYVVNPETFVSMGRSCPFAGNSVYGRCILTAIKNKTVYFNKI